MGMKHDHDEKEKFTDEELRKWRTVTLQRPERHRVHKIGKLKMLVGSQ